MRKIIIPVAAVLVLGVATAVMARGTHRGSPGVARTEGTSLLEGVLADLVAEGTITEVQADAITTALAEKRSQALEEAKAALDQLKAFWEDDVLTSDEISQLPFADRITDENGPLADALEDGEITREEFREAASDRRRWRSGGGHHMHGGKKPAGAPSQASGSVSS